MTWSPDEIVSRGRVLYEREVRHLVEQDHSGEYVVIDVDTGGFKLGQDYHALASAFRLENPSAVLCTLRIGHPTAGRIGGHLRSRPNA